MKKIKPFLINSNLCYEANDIQNYDNYMGAIQYNIGNSYISYALIKELLGTFKKVPHIQNIYRYNFTNLEKDLGYINNECTHCFFIIQDFIREKEFPLPYENLIKMFSQINIPLIIVGIGANAFNGLDPKLHEKLSPTLKNFLKFISEKCVNLGVRGEYTLDVLNKLKIQNVTATGCPSFYELGTDRKIVKQEINYNSIETDIICTSTVSNKFLINCHQVCQDFQEENIIKAVAFDDYENPLSSEIQNKILNKKYHIFSNMEDWRNTLKQYKFAIGNRVHGAVMALNSGIPAVCRNGDTRANEMCKMLNIPVRLDVNYDADIIKIYNEIDVDKINSSYTKIYENYVEFMKKNGIIIATTNQNENPDTQPTITLYKAVTNDETQKQLLKIRMQLANISNITNKIQNNKINIDNEINSKLNKLLTKPTILERIFSIKNEKTHKVLRIFGIKIKFKK